VDSLVTSDDSGSHYRRITQGARGEAGQRYHERMWTAIATCKKQNGNFFAFLSDSITAKLQAGKGPSLLQASWRDRPHRTIPWVGPLARLLAHGSVSKRLSPG
jgi:hypothetical protein